MADEVKRLNAIIPAELHTSVKVAATLSGITLNQFVIEALQEKLNKDKE